MKTITQNSEVSILEHYRILLENVELQPEILKAVDEFGYNQGEIAKGKEILNLTYKVSETNIDDDIESSEKFSEIKESITNTYYHHRKIAKVLFRNNPVVLQKLALERQIPRTYINWYNTIMQFYNQISQNDDIIRSLAKHKINDEVVNAVILQLKELNEAKAEYLKENGKSQNAAKEKDMHFELLENWMREFYTIAKIALENKPQLMKTLDVVVK